MVKSMKRSLTAKEQKTIIAYWSKNENLTEKQVIEHFEKKWKMPITRTALMMAFMTYGT